MNRVLLTGSVIVGIALMMSMSMMPAHAISLTIDDPSFESAVLADSQFTSGGPDTDWDISNGAGFFNPSGSISPETIDGDDIAYSAGGTLCQVLGDTITGDTQYSLSVWVGSRNGIGFPGYDIQLLNGDDDTLLASIDETTGNPPETGFWAINILIHTVLAGDPSIGDPLKICLSSVGQQTNFDAIRLDANPEGCSSGHWKNDATKRAEEDFDDTGFSPGEDWDATFEAVTLRVGPGKPTMEGDPTLLQALSAKGGKINALAREAVAALLNEGHADIDYPLDQGAIISLVNAAIAGDDAAKETARATLFALNHAGDDGICPLPV